MVRVGADLLVEPDGELLPRGGLRDGTHPQRGDLPLLLARIPEQRAARREPRPLHLRVSEVAQHGEAGAEAVAVTLARRRRARQPQPAW